MGRERGFSSAGLELTQARQNIQGWDRLRPEPGAR